jgi:hypothetical protein
MLQCNKKLDIPAPSLYIMRIVAVQHKASKQRFLTFNEELPCTKIS